MEFYPRNYIKKLILTNANHNLIIQIKHSNKKIMPKYIYIYIYILRHYQYLMKMRMILSYRQQSPNETIIYSRKFVLMTNQRKNDVFHFNKL